MKTFPPNKKKKKIPFFFSSFQMEVVVKKKKFSSALTLFNSNCVYMYVCVHVYKMGVSFHFHPLSSSQAFQLSKSNFSLFGFI